MIQASKGAKRQENWKAEQQIIKPHNQTKALKMYELLSTTINIYTSLWQSQITFDSRRDYLEIKKDKMWDGWDLFSAFYSQDTEMWSNLTTLYPKVNTSEFHFLQGANQILLQFFWNNFAIRRYYTGFQLLQCCCWFTYCSSTLLKLIIRTGKTESPFRLIAEQELIVPCCCLGRWIWRDLLIKAYNRIVLTIDWKRVSGYVLTRSKITIILF